MHNLRVQISSTNNMYKLDEQFICTIYMYKLDVQFTCTSNILGIVICCVFWRFSRDYNVMMLRDLLELIHSIWFGRRELTQNIPH